MSLPHSGQRELKELLDRPDTTKPIMYIIDRNVDAASVDSYLQDVDVRDAFDVVCLDTVYDFDTVYNLRRAARRLLQGPDAFPLYLFADAKGRPFYCVTTAPAKDEEHQVGLETHAKRVLAGLSDTPDEIAARAKSLLKALRPPSSTSAPVHGQLIARAFATWKPETATPAQCIAARQMADIYPEFLEVHQNLWSGARTRIAPTQPLSDHALALFSVCPTDLVNEEMDSASQIANELNNVITQTTQSSRHRAIQLIHALACLAPSSESLQAARGVLSKHILSQPIDELSLLDLAHTMNPALGLTEEIIDRSTNEFIKRANLKRSIISTPTPVSELEESYQEAWDGAEANAFVQACYQLAASRTDHRDELVELLELHATNLTAEPQFYPSLLSLFVRLLGQSDIAIDQITTRKPLPGRAVKESQLAQINSNSIHPCPWPGTNLISAPLGMGTLRLPSTGGLDLLREAWNLGVRVFDVGAHFGEGSAEEHLGRLIHEVSKQDTQAREELVIIGRAGIVSPNLRAEWERVKSTPEYDQASITYQGSTLCLTPEWLEYSLSESRHKLGVDCIDVVLLTQPELFLLDARDRNARYRDILDQEIETLLTKAFTQLEEEYRKGHIQYYGVVSATLGHPGDSIEHLSPALILRAAQKAGGKNHRCRVLQGPLNFLEPGLLDWQNASTKEEDPISVAEYLSQENVTLLTHRPLNASQGSKLHRFEPVPPTGPSEDFETALGNLKEVEATLRDSFNLPIRLGSEEISLADLFHFADELEEAVPELGGIAEWEHLNKTMITPRMKRLLQFMDQLPDPEEADAFAVLRPTWLECYNACLDATFERMRDKTLRIQDVFQQAYEPLVHADFVEHPSDAALSLLTQIPLTAMTIAGPTKPDDLKSWPRLMRQEPAADAVERLLKFGERVQSLMSSSS